MSKYIHFRANSKDRDEKKSQLILSQIQLTKKKELLQENLKAQLQQKQQQKLMLQKKIQEREEKRKLNLEFLQTKSETTCESNNQTLAPLQSIDERTPESPSTPKPHHKEDHSEVLALQKYATMDNQNENVTRKRVREREDISEKGRVILYIRGQNHYLRLIY